MSKIPLGENTDYPLEYAPDVLFPVSRETSRSTIGLTSQLPFHGSDIWNAWELTWLDGTGRPIVATAVLEVPAESPNIVESKSMKLYFNSLAMSRFASSDEFKDLISKDLSTTAGCRVSVSIGSTSGLTAYKYGQLPGTCIDESDITAICKEPHAELLQCRSNQPVVEELHSHVLRSHCPVTNQPDSGSVLIRYNGPQIDAGSLFNYIVSFRQHNDFHESCVERMFVDIKKRCNADKLTVYARYNRRGGIDINPFRSDFESTIENLRLWRQ